MLSWRIESRYFSKPTVGLTFLLLADDSRRLGEFSSTFFMVSPSLLTSSKITRSPALRGSCHQWLERSGTFLFGEVKSGMWCFKFFTCLDRTLDDWICQMTLPACMVYASTVYTWRKENSYNFDGWNSFGNCFPFSFPIVWQFPYSLKRGNTILLLEIINSVAEPALA